MIAIVVLAVGYWVTLWLMGRRDDVLHGDFVHPEGAEAAATSAPPASVFPAKPSLANRPSLTKPRSANSFPAKSPADEAVAANGLPAQPSPAPDPLDTLQSLLVSIKRDLKDAAQL